MSPLTLGVSGRWWVQCPPNTGTPQEVVSAMFPRHGGSLESGECNGAMSP